jgi:hypothetical protein
MVKSVESDGKYLLAHIIKVLERFNLIQAVATATGLKCVQVCRCNHFFTLF